MATTGRGRACLHARREVGSPAGPSRRERRESGMPPVFRVPEWLDLELGEAHGHRWRATCRRDQRARQRRTVPSDSWSVHFLHGSRAPKSSDTEWKPTPHQTNDCPQSPDPSSFRDRTTELRPPTASTLPSGSERTPPIRRKSPSTREMAMTLLQWSELGLPSSGA